MSEPREVYEIMTHEKQVEARRMARALWEATEGTDLAGASGLLNMAVTNFQEASRRLAASEERVALLEGRPTWDDVRGLMESALVWARGSYGHVALPNGAVWADAVRTQFERALSGQKGAGTCVGECVLDSAHPRCKVHGCGPATCRCPHTPGAKT